MIDRITECGRCGTVALESDLGGVGKCGRCAQAELRDMEGLARKLAERLRSYGDKWALTDPRVSALLEPDKVDKSSK